MKRTVLAVIILLLAAGACWLVLSPNQQTSPSISEHEAYTPSTQQAPTTIPPVEQWTSELVNDFQLKAMAAVMDTIGQPEFADRIETRPEFVSPAEWLILQSIAQQHDHPQQEFTRMINFLRFSKLMEIWEDSDQLPTTQRSAVAEQLLLNIPDRVTAGDLGLIDAQQMQATLINTLTVDSESRRQRLSEENARIGVTFEIN